MRIYSYSGRATVQKKFIININVTSFYPQTAESRKFRLYTVYLFSMHSDLLLYLYLSLVIKVIPWVYDSKAKSYYVSPSSPSFSREIRLW